MDDETVSPPKRGSPRQIPPVLGEETRSGHANWLTGCRAAQKIPTPPEPPIVGTGADPTGTVGDADNFAVRESRTSENHNAITDFVARSAAPITIQARRMRATWILHHANAGTPIPVFLEAAGLQSLEALDRFLASMTSRAGNSRCAPCAGIPLCRRLPILDIWSVIGCPALGPVRLQHRCRDGAVVHAEMHRLLKHSQLVGTRPTFSGAWRGRPA